jgi:hypothetical protein
MARLEKEYNKDGISSKRNKDKVRRKEGWKETKNLGMCLQHTFLLIYVLFSDATSISDSKMSKERMIND